MRLIILLVILALTASGGGFWYVLDDVCRVPVTYYIGDIDERFGTNPDEVRRIALRAEAVWEDALKMDLFSYDPEGTLPINFVFDDRQRNAEAEAHLREDIEAKEGMSESVSAQYEVLIAEFRKITHEYEAHADQYESSLSTYNDTVSEWNRKGGAPASVVEELEQEEQALTESFEYLETLSQKIDVIVSDLNKIGAKGNRIVDEYNTTVKEYNDRFAESHEFTQGDYTGTAINIYQFDAEEELVILLAHEFGHALSLGHVENEASMMFHFMEHQKVGSGVSSEDIAEFHRVCEEGRNPFVRLFDAFKKEV